MNTRVDSARAGVSSGSFWKLHAILYIPKWGATVIYRNSLRYIGYVFFILSCSCHPTELKKNNSSSQEYMPYKERGVPRMQVRYVNLHRTVS